MAGPADEARVTYKALANFLALHKAVLGAKKDLLDLKKQEADTNASSVAGSKKTAAAYRDSSKALKDKTNATRSATTAILNHNKALNDNLSLTKSTGSAAQSAAAKIKTSSDVIKDATTQHKKLGDAKKAVVFVDESLKKAEADVSSEVKKSETAFDRVVSKVTSAKRALVGYNATSNQSIPISARTANGLQSVFNVLSKIGSVRSHGNISAPFLILIPVIGALLALLNPLVAILGAVGAAGFSAGAGIASLGGAALAIIPMVSAAAAAVGGLLTAFHGIGGVFSAYSAAQKASGAGGGGGGGSGVSAADQAYNLAKAEQSLADAQQNAKDAQKSLNDARVQAVKDLKALQDAVTHDVLSEADATAQLQTATEDYYNTLADPSSTLGQKQTALANLHDAQQGVTDAQQQAVADQQTLTKAQKAGINGDQNVIDAQKELKSALQAVADAQHSLNDQVNGGGSGGSGGGVGAMDAFNAALKKLSPSAQKFVLGIIAMQGAWNKLQRTVQEAFFSKIVGDLGRLRSLLPTLTILLASAAGAMGTFAHNLIMLITSTGFKGDLLIISKQNVKLIDLAGQSVLNLVGAMKDLIIAAGPFAVKLLGSFQRLTKSFAGIVANARQTGSLAKWLDTVYGRLQQWWRIIKNVAGTLFNYGAASADFGKWITTGLEDSTQNWLKASEEARKKGSPFQTWLENLKPLERQIKGLFSDFFSWLSRTAKSNDSITQATNILSDIRTKLGPAVAKVFDSLSKSGLGDTLVKTLASIADSIAKIIKNGGAQGLKNFFKVIDTFFSAVAAFAGTPVGGWFVSVFVPAMGTLAGLTFIGKFTGLFTLFGWLIKLSKSATVLKLLAGLKSLGGLNKLGKLASGAAAGGAESSVAGAAGAAAEGAAAAGLGARALTLAKGIGSKVALPLLVATTIFDGAVALSKSIGNMQTAAKSVKPGSSTTDTIHSINKGATKDGNAAKALIPATDVVSSVLGVFSPAAKKSFDKWLGDISLSFMDFFDITIPKILVGAGKNFWNFIAPPTKWLIDTGTSIVSFFLNLPKNLGSAVSNFWSKTIPDIGMFLKSIPGAFVDLFTKKIPFATGYLATTFWYRVLPSIGSWLSSVLSDVVNWFKSLPGAVAALGINIWRGLQGIGSWLKTTGTSVVSWFKALPGVVAGLGVDVWKGLKTVGSWLNTTKASVTTWFKALPGVVTKLAINLWSGLKGIGSWLAGVGAAVVKWAKSLPGMVAKAVGNMFSNIVASFTGGAKKGKSGAIGGYASQIGSYLSSGGPVRKLGDKRFNMDPKGTDTKPAMLTPGEYVVQKKRVDEVGPANMQAFNDGVLGFAALMGKTKAGKSNQQPAFSGNGLAGTPINTSAISSSVKASTMAGASIDASSTIGSIIIQNPAPEQASVSLPSALRKAAQVAGRRKPTPRLTGVK